MLSYRSQLFKGLLHALWLHDQLTDTVEQPHAPLQQQLPHHSPTTTHGKNWKDAQNAQYLRDVFMEPMLAARPRTVAYLLR